jgi:hypothetical protein
MIEFSPELGWWSKGVFWYVVINLFLCIGFTIVVFIGGLFDLRYLLKSLDEAREDVTDDGRVISPEANTADTPPSS